MKHDFYISLIYKELNGTITVEEREQLRLWEAQDKDNKQVRDDIHQAWAISGDLNVDIDLDLEQEYASLQQKMQLEEPQVVKESPKIKTAFIRTWQIAASVAIVLLAGLWFYFNPLPSAQTLLAKQDKTYLTLSDGTEVWLREGAKLQYPKQFKDGKRTIQLEGEAFFEVVQQDNMPFEIVTKLGTVTVVGTSFNLRTEENQKLLLDVVSGKVKLKLPNGSKETLVVAKEGAVAESQLGTVTKNEQADENATAWYSGQLVFQDTPFPKLINTLERHFRIEITADNTLADCPFTNTFENADFEAVQSTLEDVLETKIIKTGPSTYHMEGGSCDE